MTIELVPSPLGGWVLGLFKGNQLKGYVGPGGEKSSDLNEARHWHTKRKASRARRFCRR